MMLFMVGFKCELCNHMLMQPFFAIVRKSVYFWNSVFILFTTHNAFWIQSTHSKFLAAFHMFSVFSVKIIIAFLNSYHTLKGFEIRQNIVCATKHQHNQPIPLRIKTPFGLNVCINCNCFEHFHICIQCVQIIIIPLTMRQHFHLKSTHIRIVHEKLNANLIYFPDLCVSYFTIQSLFLTLGIIR